ncbi:hypothetical protein JZ751_023879 [Albula glossodonta]|uniref:Uncharacterized protein n=1 Tax=Albula glossodonta TaxID=121402 RepID=A0A8T2NFJ3_9TELE|nr:hypothetical protein JZ751_023879 [Albula glossodonta]
MPNSRQEVIGILVKVRAPTSSERVDISYFLKLLPKKENSPPPTLGWDQVSAEPKQTVASLISTGRSPKI